MEAKLNDYWRAWYKGDFKTENSDLNSLFKAYGELLNCLDAEEIWEATDLLEGVMIRILQTKDSA